MFCGKGVVERFRGDTSLLPPPPQVLLGQLVIGTPNFIGTPCYWHSKRYGDTLLLTPQTLLGHLVIGTPNVIGPPCYWQPKRRWDTLLLAP